MESTAQQQQGSNEATKAANNAMFKKLEEILMKMPSDPALFEEDVLSYNQLFLVEYAALQGDTMRKNERFGELLTFLARAARHFPRHLEHLPGCIFSLINELGATLHSYNRRKAVSGILILRARSVLPPVETIKFLLRQLSLEDKQLRETIFKFVLNDIRRMNKHHRNLQINQQLRKHIATFVAKEPSKSAEKALLLMTELYRRNIWVDRKVVNTIAEACFSPAPKLRMIACHFLISTTETLPELSDSDEENPV